MALCVVQQLNSAPRSCARTKRLRLRVLIYHNDVWLRKRGWDGRWPVMFRDDNGELKLELELELCKQERRQSARSCTELTLQQRTKELVEPENNVRYARIQTRSKAMRSLECGYHRRACARSAQSN